MTTGDIAIVVARPGAEPQHFRFAAPTVVVGRDPTCDLQLDERSISRQHLALRRHEGRVLVRDLSRNGTFVDGMRLAREQPLEPGHTVLLGPFVLRLEPPGAVQAAPEHEPPAATPTPMPPATAAAEPVTPTPVPPPPSLDEIGRWLRDKLLDSLDIRLLRPDQLEGDELRGRIVSTLDALMDEHARRLPASIDRARLRKQMLDELLGLGPLEDLLADASVSEIMVVDRETIYVEQHGRISLSDARFSSDDSLRAAIERIVTPLGRRIDESTPMVDARLRDGSRVNAIIPPLAIKGASITIRKFPHKRLGVDDLIARGSVDGRMARFLERCVRAKRNVIVSGGTGSGKTTLLNILSSAIPASERIVTIEDAAELSLRQPHVVSLETRPKNMEGKGEYTIRDLVRNALRMRPDRIIVGECRGGEALDMLQAMNTGHDGSLTTIHANSPSEALSRLETLVLMSGVDLPTRAIREQIASSINVVVQQARFSDGSRRIVEVSEVLGIQDDGSLRTEAIFRFCRQPDGADGRVRGIFRATGYLPSFLELFVTLGLVTDEAYL